jgi:hypothetical protein
MQGRPEERGSTFIRNVCTHHPDVQVDTTDITIRNLSLFITVLIGFINFQAQAGPSSHQQLVIASGNAEQPANKANTVTAVTS